MKILWVVGMMINSTSSVNNWLKAVYQELGGESAGLYTVTVTKDTAGGASHPSLSGHSLAASTIQAYVTEKNLLG